MSNASDTRYLKERLRLIRVLGGRCVDCLTRRRLELDHRWATRWNRRSHSKKQRLDEYRKAMDDNNLAVRCRICNAKKGFRLAPK